MKKTVGVIGAGPAGLVAVKELKQAGLDVTAFDRASQVGGIWASDVPKGVWKELTMNINRRFLEYSDYPWKENYYEGHEKAHHGFFPHNSETKALYLQDYARNFGLMENIQLKTDVKSIEKGQEGGWKVTTAPRGGGGSTTHTFDFLVVCSGVNGAPYNPLADGIFKAFTGEKIHSQQFTTVKGFEGKRVLTIGGLVSGADIPSELARNGNCASVVSSVRRMPMRTHVVSQTNHKLYDDILLIRFPTLLMKVLPDAITTKGLKSEILSNWPDQPTIENAGVSVDDDIRNSMFAPDRYYMESIKESKISVKPEVSSVVGKTVTFMDGSKEEFDSVIFCTGFNMDLSYLPQEVQDKISFVNPVTSKRDVALYKMTLAPGLKDMAFCGLLYNYGPHFTMAEMQARLIAAIFSGKLGMPSDETLQAGIEKLKAFRSTCLLNKGDLSTVFCDDIGKDLCVAPTITQCLWNPKSLLFSPAYPCFYRTNAAVDGEEVAKKAKERFDNFMKNPQVAPEL